MDNNYYDENLTEEQLAQQQTGNTGVSRRVDQFSSGLGNFRHSKEDIDAVKNRRGKNEQVGRRTDEDETTDGPGSKGSSLEKDGLEDKDGLKKDEKGKGKDGKAEAKGKGKADAKGKATGKGGLLDKVKGKDDEKSIKKKWKSLKLKIKIAAIVAAVLGAILSVIVMIALFIAIFDTFLSAVSTFFGVNDSNKEEAGLVDNDEYEGMNDTELIQYLNENKGYEEATWWNGFTDWLSGKDFDSIDEFLRYVEKTVSKIEKEYNVKLDRSIILSTIFYGYAAQPTHDNFIDIPVEESVGADNHYDSIVDILTNGDIINYDQVEKIIMFTLFDTTYLDKPKDGKTKYYTWVIREEKKDPDDPNSATEKVAYCEAHPTGNKGYSSAYWQMFMRYGEDNAKEYRQRVAYKLMYEGSDEECNAEAALPTGTYDRLDGSVTTARNLFTSRGKPKSTVGYDQYANIRSGEKDNLTFDYRDGFAYINFPLYKDAIESSETKIQWDDISTPKYVEHTINDALSRKSDFNQILLLEDMDTLIDYSNLNTNGFITTGAYCGQYLTAPLDGITVELKNCDGNVFYTTSFKDYIIGVTYGEIGGSPDNEEYAKTQMLAAISYSLNRRNNYQKGSVISMRSGNCDQVYCCPSKGCHAETSGIDCGGFKCTSYVNGPNSSGNYWKGIIKSDAYNKLSTLYDEASQFLIVNEGEGKVFGAHYVSTYQNRWENMAKQGYAFTTILQNEYADEGASVIKCADEQAKVEDESPTPDGEKEGNTTSSTYPEKAPDKGIYYGFAYAPADGRNIKIDPAWKSENITTITASCPAAGWSQSMTVHKKSVSKWEAANEKICKLLTTGVTINGKKCVLKTSDLDYGGAFVERKTSAGGFSLHGYGLAMDWNYSSSYTINGKSYKPYASMGSSTKKAYNEFVAALGSENDCRNINYVLWKHAYEPSGFNWGGTWSESSFDPMHFEVRYK